MGNRATRVAALTGLPERSLNEWRLIADPVTGATKVKVRGKCYESNTQFFNKIE